MMAFGMDLSHSAAKKLSENCVGAPLPGADLVRHRVELYPATADLGPEQERHADEPAAGDAHEGHARVLRIDHPHAPGGHRRLLPGLEHVPNRTAGVDHPNDLSGARGHSVHQADRVGGRAPRRQAGAEPVEAGPAQADRPRQQEWFVRTQARAGRGLRRWPSAERAPGSRPYRAGSTATSADGQTQTGPGAVDLRQGDASRWPTGQEAEVGTMEWVETTAKTVQEAKDVALDRLGVAEDDAEFEVLEEPRPGLFGRMRGEARVRARVRPSVPRPKLDRRDRRRRGGRERGAEVAVAPDGAATAATAPGVAPTRTRGARPALAAGGAAPVAAAGQTPHARRAARLASMRTTMSPLVGVTRRILWSRRTTLEEEGDIARAFMTGLLDAFGDAGEVTVDLVDGEVEVLVTGPDLGLLIGPRRTDAGGGAGTDSNGGSPTCTDAGRMVAGRCGGISQTAEAGARRVHPPARG